jgi:hypothetical protein
MEIIIRDIIGSRCIIKQDGIRIHDLILGSLKKGESVTLDFIGVNQFASPFFNFAIGLLLNEIDESEVRRLLHVVNINPIGENLVVKVIENSAKYYKDSRYKTVVDEILDQQSKEAK